MHRHALNRPIASGGGGGSSLAASATQRPTTTVVVEAMVAGFPLSPLEWPTVLPLSPFPDLNAASLTSPLQIHGFHTGSPPAPLSSHLLPNPMSATSLTSPFRLHRASLHPPLSPPTPATTSRSTPASRVVDLLADDAKLGSQELDARRRMPRRNCSRRRSAGSGRGMRQLRVQSPRIRGRGGGGVMWVWFVRMAKEGDGARWTTMAIVGSNLMLLIPSLAPSHVWIAMQ